MNSKESSPFTPGSPVPVELFVGRSKQIAKLRRYATQAKSGKLQSAFLVGSRGIGKSSLGSLMKEFLAAKEDLLAIHVFLGKVDSLEEMVREVFDGLLKNARGKKWFEKVSGLFGESIRDVGLFGVTVGFAPRKNDLEQLVRNFPSALANFLKRMKGEHAGLFIVLDDINGLVEKSELANWYKSFSDEVATHYSDFPVFIMMIGLPEKRDALARLQPSLMRIFQPMEIDRLSDPEVEAFLHRAFQSRDMNVDASAMDLMVRYSSGLPILMHEIGDATFWADTDGRIDQRDVVRGLVAAAEQVGRKYLDPQVYSATRSKNYRSILKKLAAGPVKAKFTKKEVEAKLNDEEKKVFHNFLTRMRKLGVIELDQEGGRGAYRFVNEIYPLYIFLGQRASQATKGSKKAGPKK